MISSFNIQPLFNSRFCLLLGSMLITIAFAPALVAQKLEPVTDEDSQPSTTSIEIRQIYNLTEIAKSISDYQRIVQLSEKMIATTVFDKDKAYLNSIVAWARNRWAQQHARNAALMRDLGLQTQAEQEQKLAIEQFDIVIRDYPLTWRSWMGRAVIHAEKAEYEQAYEKFREVTKLNLKNNNAWFNCAEICLHLKQYDQAIDYYSRLIVGDPTDVLSLTGRGHCFMAVEKLDEAIEDYRTVAKLMADDEVALRNLAAAYAANDQEALANDVLSRALRLGQSAVRQATNDHSDQTK